MKPQPRKTAVQLLNHYFAQALYFYNTKEAAENKYFCMYGDTFFGAKSMIKLLSNDEELNNHAENLAIFLNEIERKTQKEISAMFEKVRGDL